MKRRIFSILIVFIFLFTNTSIAYAKGGVSSHSSGARSSGVSSSKSSTSRSVTGSSSKSSGYSGSSSSKSTTSGSSSSSSSSKSSGSTSSSSGSTSSSSGYSGSSSSKSSTSGTTSSGSSGSTSSSSGYSGSSSSKSSTSGSSSVSGSSSSSSKSTVSGSSTSSKTTSKTESLKNSYMSDAYKKQASSSNYTNYKQKLSDEQKSTYDASMNKNYYSGQRMDFEQAAGTRTTRMTDYNTRPIRININTGYFGGPMSYGMAFAGPWDMWFLMRASDLFWYHHWTDIYPYRNYFEAAQFAEMESRIRNLEAQNLARDPNYAEPGVDPDLMFSSDYQEKNIDKIYYTNKYSKPVSNPFTLFIPILLISVGLILVIYTLSRRKPKKPTRNSRGIY